jgi:predicted Fe-Mo cluster-binding NifX family protein
MQIGVASANTRHVTGHVGHCQRFWIYEVGRDGVRDKRLLELGPGQSLHETAGNADHPLDAVKVLITGGMGQGLSRRLASRGIEGIVTAETDPDAAVRAYLAGALDRQDPHPGAGEPDHDRHHGCDCTGGADDRP